MLDTGWACLLTAQRGSEGASPAPAAREQTAVFPVALSLEVTLV